MKKRYFVITLRTKKDIQTHYVEVMGGKYISKKEIAEQILGDRNNKDFVILFLMELSEKDFKDLLRED